MNKAYEIEEDVLTYKKIERIYGVSIQKIYNMIAKEGFPRPTKMKIQRGHFSKPLTNIFDKSLVEEWFEKNGKTDRRKKVL